MTAKATAARLRVCEKIDSARFCGPRRWFQVSDLIEIVDPRAPVALGFFGENAVSIFSHTLSHARRRVRRPFPAVPAFPRAARHGSESAAVPAPVQDTGETAG
jgi:hypothetical protein